jgi:cytochrome c oxidase assembly factor CtaG
MSGPSVLDVLGTWSIDPVLTLTLGLTGTAYLVGAGRVDRWPARRSAAFLAGLACLALALESGLDVYGDELLSVHVVQHLVLVVVAAPLLLAAAPITLVLRSIEGPRRQAAAELLRSRPARILGHPACGLAAIGAAMLATHLTPLYGLALRDPAVHVAEHLGYVTSGLLFWAVLIAPGPAPKRLDGLGQIVYLLLGMPLMGVVGVILETDPAPRYVEYLAPAGRLGISALADQRLAGAVMWIVGTTIMGVVALSLAWRSMLAEERRAVAREFYEARAAGEQELG